MTVGVHLPNDSPNEWVSALRTLLPAESVRNVEDTSDADGIEILIVGNPAATELRKFPSVRFVQSTWAGPERLSSDPDRPDIPIARVVGGALATAMAEYVAAAVLSAHRRFPEYRRQQTARNWNVLDQPMASQRTIGILGFGPMAKASAAALTALGFNVMAWARSQRDEEIPVVAGPAAFSELLGASAAVVNLLPLTTETEGILDASAFRRFQAGAALIHCGRGKQLNVPDLISALDSGLISHAWLDVFSIEPLPSDSALWTHPAVTLTPHVAARSAPELIAVDIAANITRFRSGESPAGMV